MTARQSTLEMDFGRELFVNLRVGGGRFVLRRLLGRGPLSEVWLALDTQTDRDVALKWRDSLRAAGLDR